MGLPVARNAGGSIGAEGENIDGTDNDVREGVQDGGADSNGKWDAMEEGIMIYVLI